MITIFVDKKKYTVKKSENLLFNCLNIGIDLPYFCWHPELGSIGACRQCAVTVYQDEHDATGRIAMACMTTVRDKMRVSVNEKEESLFRKSNIEYLMINHPHDCPVCAEGGNCHLQDMTVMTKHVNRKYNFPKKTYTNQYLGPFISHEMNRCISCYRCVRYYKDYCDGKDFGVYGSGQRMYFGRLNPGILENEHSGNLVEICPTGVFTDKIHTKNYYRKWDAQHAPSICQHCSIGCNIISGEKYGEIQKIENRYNYNINRYFICDLGRFGYNHSNSEKRIKNPYIVKDNTTSYLKKTIAIKIASKILKQSSNIIGIGSSRASLESNYSLMKLVGKENFSNGMLDIEHKNILLFIQLIKNNEIKSLSLKELEECDSILVIGEDITQTSSRMALSIRQAIKKKSYFSAVQSGIPKWHAEGIKNFYNLSKNTLFFIGSDENKLNDITTYSHISSIEEQLNVIKYIYKKIKNYSIKENTIKKSNKKNLDFIYDSLIKANRPLIISGSRSGNDQIIKQSLKIARAIYSTNQNARIAFLPISSNSIGLSLLGGKSLDEILLTKKENFDSIFILENDLYYWLTKKTVDSFFKKIRNIVVLDHQQTNTIKKANLVFPVCNFYESSGTVINYESRAQRFFKTYKTNFYNSNTEIHESWKWLSTIRHEYLEIDKKTNKINLDVLTKNLSKHSKYFCNLEKFFPNSHTKIFGQKIPRSPNRSSGRTSILSNISVHEPKQPTDQDSMFAFSMEGSNHFNKYSSYVPFIWSPGWNSPQGWNKFQKEIGKDLINGSPGFIILKKEKNKHKSIILEEKTAYQKNILFYVSAHYKLFGNEEITQYSFDIKERMDPIYALINFQDAKRYNVKENSKITFMCFNQHFEIQVKFSKTLSNKTIALPIGRKNFPYVLLGKPITNFKEK